MSYDISFFISIASILTMMYCLEQVVTLKSEIPGGMVGKRWNFLMVLVGLFTAGYLATPFFRAIPQEWTHLIVSLIFLFGAIYVLVTVRLIFRVIAELTE